MNKATMWSGKPQMQEPTKNPQHEIQNCGDRPSYSFPNDAPPGFRSHLSHLPTQQKPSSMTPRIELNNPRDVFTDMQLTMSSFPPLVGPALMAEETAPSTARNGFDLVKNIERISLKADLSCQSQPNYNNAWFQDNIMRNDPQPSSICCRDAVLLMDRVIEQHQAIKFGVVSNTSIPLHAIEREKIWIKNLKNTLLKQLQQVGDNGSFIERENVHMLKQCYSYNKSDDKITSVIMSKPAKFTKESFHDMIEKIQHREDQPAEIDDGKGSDDRKDPFLLLPYEQPWVGNEHDHANKYVMQFSVPENKACKDINDEDYVPLGYEEFEHHDDCGKDEVDLVDQLHDDEIYLVEIAASPPVKQLYTIAKVMLEDMALVYWKDSENTLEMIEAKKYVDGEGWIFRVINGGDVETILVRAINSEYLLEVIGDCCEKKSKIDTDKDYFSSDYESFEYFLRGGHTYNDDSPLPIFFDNFPCPLGGDERNNDDININNTVVLVISMFHGDCTDDKNNVKDHASGDSQHDLVTRSINSSNNVDGKEMEDSKIRIEHDSHKDSSMSVSFVLKMSQALVSASSSTPREIEKKPSLNELSSTTIISHFFLAQEAVITLRGKGVDDNTKVNLTMDPITESTLKAALESAKPFVPEKKLNQWNTVPHVLIAVDSPRHHSDTSLPPSDEQPWQQTRRSIYDESFANVLNYLNRGEYSLSRCLYFDSSWLHQREWQHCHQISEMLKENKRSVLEYSDYFEAYTKNGKNRYGSFGTGDNDLNTVMSSDAESIANMSELVTNTPSFQSSISMQRNKTKYGYGEKFLLNKKLKSVKQIRGYLLRMLSMLEMERIRSLEDMKRHDLYSVQWLNGIEIPPPKKAHQKCRACGSHCGNSLPSQSNSNFLCAYHHACMLFREDDSNVSRLLSMRKPIPMNSKERLEILPLLFRMMRPVDKIVVKIEVPGVAENYPLVSIGDIVRLRFNAVGYSNEVLGEVANVVIKTEIITVLLPPPFCQNREFSFSTLPYVQALLSSKFYIVDAQHICVPNPSTHSRIARPRVDADNQVGRFDVRFGLFGGVGFDISRKSLLGAVSLTEIRKADNYFFNYMVHIMRCVCPIPYKQDIWETIEDTSTDGFQNKKYTFNWVQSVNEEQKRAVSDIVNNSHGSLPYIIFGPPGTGKTLTIVEAVIQTLLTKENSKIMVCAPSDAACDVLAIRIQEKLTNQHGLLRVNYYSRKVESLPPVLLQCSTLDEGGIFAMPLFHEIKAASVIICQCFVSGCLPASSRLKSHFTHLFIDESSQAMECEALVPLLAVDETCSIILAGDPNQLSPTVRDSVAARMGLRLSLQERLMGLPVYQTQSNDNELKRPRAIANLLSNYRSHKSLLEIPSQLFYKNSLKCLASSEVCAPYSNIGSFGEIKFPMIVYDVHEGVEKSKVDSPSFYNLEECDAIVEIIQGLMESDKIHENGKMHPGEIAVLAPFRAQVLALRVKLRSCGLGSCNVGVVEDFQGQEKRVVLISTVLTQAHDRWDGSNRRNRTQLGFMHDPKRFNVAITRAHALCIIVGNLNYLKTSNTYWTALIEHVHNNDGVLTRSGNSEDDIESTSEPEGSNGISKLVKRVEELKLLGSSEKLERYDLSFYYQDSPEWKVMLF